MAFTLSPTPTAAPAEQLNNPNLEFPAGVEGRMTTSNGSSFGSFTSFVSFVSAKKHSAFEETSFHLSVRTTKPMEYFVLIGKTVYSEGLKLSNLLFIQGPELQPMTDGAPFAKSRVFPMVL